jgi:drug/metabolite transporter (DMT)-like permease
VPLTTEGLLQRALSRGVITPEQHASILALAAEDGMGAREMPRGFNWVTVAYALGALLVVFAGGWFLAQRWLSLGPAGVLGVVLFYAVLAGAASVWLERRDFREAAGLAAMVAVSLTPVVVWALESLTGLWPAETWGQPYYPSYPPAEASRWLVAELATILAALIVLRKRPWWVVVFPIAVSLFGLAMHLPRAIGIDLTPILEKWIWLTSALVVCAIADATDRRVPRQAGPGRGDMAFPLWTVGLVALALALLSFWPTAGAWRHATPALGVGAIVLSLMIGRKTHLVFGVVLIFMYLMYLAGEVFRSTAYFPVALAALGGLMLFATVWMQRRFPALASRLGAKRSGRGGLPGSPWMPWIFAGAALGITLLRADEAKEERLNREFQQRLYILRLHSGSLRAPPMRPIPGPESGEPRVKR